MSWDYQIPVNKNLRIIYIIKLYVVFSLICSTGKGWQWKNSKENGCQGAEISANGECHKRDKYVIYSSFQIICHSAHHCKFYMSLDSCGDVSFCCWATQDVFSSTGKLPSTWCHSPCVPYMSIREMRLVGPMDKGNLSFFYPQLYDFFPQFVYSDFFHFQT